MRCPSCGTQNEPDSRFCGGCGARLSGTLAPTQKIQADAQVVAAQPAPGPRTPQRHAGGQGPELQPASQAQPSAQQVAQRQALASAQQAVQRPPPAVSTPQPAQRQPSVQQVAQRQPSAQRAVPAGGPQPAQRSSSAAPGAYVAPRSTPHEAATAAVGSSPRRSMDEAIAVPKRNWGLIAVVLVFDLGLAAAGAYLLNEGLSAGQSEPNAGEGSTAPGIAPKTGSIEPKPGGVATGGSAVAPVAPAKPAGGPPGEVGSGSSSGSGSALAASSTEPAGSGSAQGRKTTKRRGPSKGPQDPYEDPLPREVPQGPPLGPQGPPPPPPDGER